MKRIFDLITASFILVLFSLLLIFIAILVRFKLGSPIFFVQKRPGLNFKPFYLYKFRTMTDQKDKYGLLLSDEERLTNFGAFLRKYSLDEIPQLFNVIKGDISLVGPRPLLMEYIPLYSQSQAKRNLVKPGITGWAQINGRNNLSWEEKFELDLWYVENRSLFLDIRILFLTIFKVINMDGISHKNHVTMPVFRGSVDNEKEY